MCGIIGFIDARHSQDHAKTLLENLLLKTHHRGPDHTGVFHDAEAHLGHNRLSIIDLSHEADQPFHRGKFSMVYNGEVYNYLEIKEELENLGHSFLTSSDTEVILAAYEQWGEQCVERFVGMWAFAIWDKEERSLFASRDRFGIKPFHYIHQGRSFYFASELKALRMSPLFTGEVSESQMALGLQLGLLQDGEFTYYEQIKNLPAAHNLSYREGNLKVWRYWDIKEVSCDDRPFEEKKEDFKRQFLESIRIHLRSDVALGACLSGGLDSSSIACSVSHLFESQELNTFSIYYAQKGFDERQWIDKVTKAHPNLKPTLFSPSEEDLQEHFEKFFYHQDIPVAGSSPYSQYFLMRLAKERGVKVTLDGQGADEYLAGYLHSFYHLLADNVAQLRLGKAVNLYRNHSGLREMNGSQKKDLLVKSGASLFMKGERLTQLQMDKAMPYLPRQNFQVSKTMAPKSWNRFDSYLHTLSFQSTLPNLLHYEDRNSMAFSIESRVPFLDHRLVEAVFRMMPEDKIKQGVTKTILREAMKGIIPDAIYRRQDKMGFSTPGEVRWLRGPMSHLLDMNEHTLTYLDEVKTKEVLSQFKSGNNRDSKLVWRLAMLNKWLGTH